MLKQEVENEQHLEKKGCRKRIIALFLVTALVMGSTVSAFAAEESTWEDIEAGVVEDSSESGTQDGVADSDSEETDGSEASDSQSGSEEDIEGRGDAELIPEDLLEQTGGKAENVLPETMDTGSGEDSLQSDTDHDDVNEDDLAEENYSPENAEDGPVTEELQNEELSPEEGETLAPVTINIRESSGEDDSEELFSGYVDRLFDFGGTVAAPKRTKNSVDRSFDGASQDLYSGISSGAQEIAAGQRESAEFIFSAEELGYGNNIFWSASELGISAVVTDGSITQEALDQARDKFEEEVQTDKVIKALLADFPYEFYWHDKKTGTSRQINIGAVYSDGEWRCCVEDDYTISFSVAEDFAVSQYIADTEKTGAASLAVENAQAVLDASRELPDLDKLYAYKNAICEDVSYNNTIEEGSSYGNPWQLIWVFDGDDTTNDVCEGYSKAFQYLCNKTQFSNDSICGYSVTGTMFDGTEREDHMWNIVTLEDGKNYLADVTNSDSGSIGQNGELFLVPYTSGSVQEGYVFRCGDNTDVSYVYDEDTVELFSTEELTIAAAAGEKDPLEIILQPETVNVRINETVVLHVEANREDASYQWQWSTNGNTWKNCTSSGCNTDTFRFRMVKVMDGRSYRCIVTLGEETITSDTALITLDNTSLEITSQPQDVSVCAGEMVSLHVGANTDDVTYQWQWSADGNNWRNCTSSGYNTDTFSFLMKTALAGRYYRCKVSSGNANLFSNNARIYLDDFVLEITEQPMDVNAMTGETVSLHVRANREDAVYQWQYSTNQSVWKNCTSSGYNTDTFSFLMKAALAGRCYRCAVSFGSTKLFSDNALISLDDSVLEITDQPEDVIAGIGEAVNLHVGVNKSDAAFQWQYCTDQINWKNCTSTGADTDTFSFTMKAVMDQRRYRCKVYKGNSVVFSNTILLTLKSETEEPLVTATGECGENVTWTLYDNGLLQISGTGEMASYNAYARSRPWYGLGSGIKQVEIGDGVTSIGDYAFAFEKALTKVQFGDAVERIGSYAFFSDSVLEDFQLPESLTSIESGAFDACSALTGITIPAGVTHISSMAFHNTSGVTAYTVAEGNTAYCSAGGVLFTNDKKKLLNYPASSAETSYTLPAAVRTIEAYAFNKAVNLETVILNYGLQTIDNYAFNGCTGLQEIDIPDTVTAAGSNLFEGCTSLARAATGTGIKTIPNHMFCKCMSLSDLAIRGAVTSIEDAAFAGCASLPNFEIPDTVNRLGSAVFSGCTSFTEMTIGSNITTYHSGSSMFEGCTSLETVVLENNKVITGKMFKNCSALKNITFTDGTKQIGEEAFFGCSSLEGIPLENITYIGENAFEGCSALKSVTLAEGITSVYERTFYGCTSLEEVSLPQSLTSIGYCAFARNTSLTTVTIPDAVTTIDKYAFLSSNGIRILNMGAGIESVGEQAFEIGITDVYYAGSEEDWNRIIFGNYNSWLQYATIHFAQSQ